MKIILWFLGLLVALVIGIYVIAFTPMGNAIVGPMLETKIQEQTKLDSKLSTFNLGMSDFEILIDLDAHNSVYAKGTYSLLNQSFDAQYDVKLKKLETLEALTNKPLMGPLFTDGSAVGDMALANIDGKSDVALSTTVYHVTLTNLEVSSIIAKIQNADLVSLLQLAGEKPYAQGKIDADVNFKNIKPHQLDGNILLTTKEGVLDNILMSKDFEIEIPKTKFDMSLDAKLKGDDVDYIYALNSNLAKIKSSGNIVPEPLKVDVVYALDVKELAVLKPIIKQDVRGPFTLEGTAKGTQENMRVEGTSDVAMSDTHFSAILKNNKPVSLNANIDKLQIEKLLYMLKQPHYGDGILSLNVDMEDLREGNLKGNVIANIKKGLLNSKYLTKEHEFKSLMPQTSFNLITNTDLHGDMTQTKLHLKSSLVALDIEKANYNLKDKSISSDFTTTIPDLDQLFFLTERHLKGAITLNGTIKKAQDLDLKVHSKVAGGTLDAKLFNDDLAVDLQSIQTMKALEMLIYPEIFDSSLNGKLAYNTKEQKGTFNGDLADGKFAPNMMLTMVKQYGQVDLYKEKFTGDVKADINKEKLLASLALKSNTSAIEVENAKLDSKEKTVDATVKITANKHPISVTLKGNTSAPKVSVDAGDIMKDQVIQQINKKVGGDVGSLLKSFF